VSNTFFQGGGKFTLSPSYGPVPMSGSPRLKLGT